MTEEYKILFKHLTNFLNFRRLTTMTNQLDQQKIDAFGEQMLTDVSRMMLLPLAYIGDQLDLFGCLHEDGPLTPEELGKITSCNVRYLEEWLSAMASVGWLDYDPEERTFNLPPEHALFLSEKESTHYMAPFLEWGRAFGQMADEILDCFRSGGGIALEDHHPDTPRLIDRLSAPKFTNFLTDVWIADLLPDLHQKLMEGARVADVGCGLGMALIEMGREYPNSVFEGFEPDETSAERSRRRVREEGLEDRVTVHTSPASALDQNTYDLVTTFDVIHDLPAPQRVINDIYEAIKPGGTFLMQEMNASENLEEMHGPLGTMLYSISTMYCLTVSLAHDGAGIGTCMGESLPREMCREAGFVSFERLEFDHPFHVIYTSNK